MAYCSNPMCWQPGTGMSTIDKNLYCGKNCQPSPLIGYRNPETDTLHCDSPGCLNDVIGQIGLSDYCLEHLTEEAARRKRQREVTPPRPQQPPPPPPPADVYIEALKQASAEVERAHEKFLAKERIQQADEDRRIADAAISRDRFAAAVMNATKKSSNDCPSCSDDSATCETCDVGRAEAAYRLSLDILRRIEQSVQTQRDIRRMKHARKTRELYRYVFLSAGGKGK